MWLTGTAQTAMHAVVCIAEHGAEAPITVADVAARLDVPRNYLSKTLHQLAREGVLEAVRGPRGGFRLARPAERLTLAAIVAPLVNRVQPRCLLGRTACRDDNPCPAHGQWSVIRGSFEAFLAETTIADLLPYPPPTMPTAPSRPKEVAHVPARPG
jgi:Rrf2 family protein